MKFKTVDQKVLALHKKLATKLNANPKMRKAVAAALKQMESAMDPKRPLTMQDSPVKGG